VATHAAIAIGLVIYACAMLLFSSFWARRISKPSDYLVGGRSFTFWVLIGTVTAGSIGPGVIVGASGLSYQHGWAGAAYPIGLGVGTALTGLLFAVMRRYKFMTLGEEVASYYGARRVVVEFSNVMLFFSQLCWLTVMIMGGADVLVAVTTLPRDVCVIVAACIIGGIAIPGGLKSVVYTDFLQATILVSGFAVLTFSALHRMGGWNGMRQSMPPAYFSFLGVASYGKWTVAGLLLSLVLAVIADPGRRLGMYSARSESGARWGLTIAGIIVVIFSATIGITGMYAFRLNPHLANPDESLLWLVMNVLPAWLAATVVVSVASGIVSCANWDAIAAGTFFVRHIYPLATGRYLKRPLLAIRVALVFAIAASATAALHFRTIVGFVVKFLPVTMSGLAIIILLGRFWRRGTWQGALAALIVTPVVSLAVMFAPAQFGYLDNPVVPTLAGIFAHVAVSLLTPRTLPGFDQVVEAMNRERETVEGEREILPSGGIAAPASD
jgi:SSS family solute:Na+ symporter